MRVPTPKLDSDSAGASADTRRGVVLFVVVIVVALVSLSSYGFVVMTQTEFRAARIRGDQLQVESIAHSGWEYMATHASMTRYERHAIGGLQQNPDRFQSVMVDRTDLSRPGRFSIVSPFYRQDAIPTESAIAYRQFGMVNESSKLSLALILEWDQQFPGSGRSALMKLPSMTESIADAILDWMDEDNLTREFGAEAEFYETLHPKRKPLNSVPTRIEELMQVRGVSRGLLLGIDIDRNYRDEEHEKPQSHHQQSADHPLNSISQDQETDEALRPWSNFLTTNSAEHNLNVYGEPRIFLNTPNLVDLHQQLTETFNQQVADFVVTLRIQGPYDGSKTPSITPAPKPSLTSAATYEFVTPFDAVRSTVATGDEENPVIHSSPFSSQFALGEFTTSDFLDNTTTTDSAVVEHRVNVNQASPTVLRSLPGITAETADRIAMANQSERQESDVRHIHAYWLVQSQVIDQRTFAKIAPYVTVGGNVYSAQIVAFYDAESPWFRLETTIDGTDVRPRPLYYGLLNHLGRGFQMSEISKPIDALESMTENSPTEMLLPGRNQP